MSPELDEKLVKKYPEIFRNRYGDMTTTCMCWGFECGNGWYNLIDRLCSHLQFQTNNNNSHSNEGRNPQIVASQVKEKFGGLRFYVESATERQYAVISFAEALSYYICEKCGSMDNIGITQGWLRTLCEKCHDPESNWKIHKEDETNNQI